MDTREKIRQYRLLQADEDEIEESNRLQAQRQHWLPAREPMQIVQDLEKEPWRECRETLDGRITAIGALPCAGKPVVLVRGVLSDGRTVVVQTSLQDFMAAADAIWLKYGRTQQFSGG